MTLASIIKYSVTLPQHFMANFLADLFLLDFFAGGFFGMIRKAKMSILYDTTIRIFLRKTVDGNFCYQWYPGGVESAIT